MKAFLALIFTILPLCAVEPSFTNMENGDRIELSWQTQGCFHHDEAHYEVTKSDGKTTFARVTLSWEDDEKTKLIGKRVISQIELTPSEIKGLAKMIAFFRSPQDSFSTTSHDLTIEYFEGEKRVKTEKLSNSSGDEPPQLYDLQQRLEKSAKSDAN